MTSYKGRYHNESIRKPGYNYGSNGEYFITLNTHNRDLLFGKIENGKMVLSEIGNIVHSEWLKSFEIRSELQCDVWVIMPDHLHAIISINKENQDIVRNEEENRKNYGVAYRPPNSISSFVAGFKSAATRHINEIRKTPGKPVWQSRFYDHIIRNSNELERIRNYIISNPCNYLRGKSDQQSQM
jgi:putative transposase